MMQIILLLMDLKDLNLIYNHQQEVIQMIVILMDLKKEILIENHQQ